VHRRAHPESDPGQGAEEKRGRVLPDKSWKEFDRRTLRKDNSNGHRGEGSYEMVALRKSGKGPQRTSRRRGGGTTRV